MSLGIRTTGISLPHLLALVMLLVGPQRTEAYVLLGYQWPGSHPRVPVHVSTGLVPYNGTFEQGVTAVQSAISIWNTQGGSNFKFFYAGSTEVSTVANDGINAILYNPNRCPYEGTGCTAETILHRGADDTIEGFDVILYGQSSSGQRLNWYVGNSVDITEIDIWGLVLHELGHGLGLAHSDIFQTLMGGSAGIGDMHRGIQGDDVLGIKALYGPYTNEGLWVSNTNPIPGDLVTLFMDYPRAARQSYQIVADFDGLNTGWELRNSWLADSRIFPPDRCPYPAGSREPTALESLVLPANSGVLDSNGRAQVTVRVPENLSCFPTNRQWFFSVVTYGTNLPSGIEDVGVAVALNIQTPPGPPLRIRSVNRAFSLVELRWPARADHPHQIESSTTLTQWTAFGPLLPALPFDGWLTSLVSVAQSPQFFRVRELPPPGVPCESGVLALMVSTNFVRVPEGGTASFTVQLSSPPGPGGFGVGVTRTGGDTGLELSGNTSHIFHNTDWNVPVTFTISASPDADAVNGVATFTLTGNHGLSSVTVTAVEVDDDR